MKTRFIITILSTMIFLTACNAGGGGTLLTSEITSESTSISTSEVISAPTGEMISTSTPTSEQTSSEDESSIFDVAVVDDPDNLEGNPQKKYYDMLYPIYKDGKYGYIDIDGNIVVKPKFDWAYEFSEGYAIVYVESKSIGFYKSGYLDLSGKVAIPLEDGDCGFFSENLADVERNGYSVYINKSNEVVFKHDFNLVGPFNEGVAKVRDKDAPFESSILIDTTGKVIANFGIIYFADELSVGNMSNGLIRVYGSYYNRNGEKVLAERFNRRGNETHLPNDFSEGLAVYPVLKKAYLDKEYDHTIESCYKYNDADSDEWCDIYENDDNWEYIYINTSGEQVLGAYDKASSFSGGYAVVEKNGEKMVIDKVGSVIFQHNGLEIETPQHSSGLYALREESEAGYFVYNEGGKYGILDLKGNIVIPAQYDYVVRTFKNGLAYVGNKDGIYMYINKQGKVVWSGKQM